ncbi:FUSC family protein [Heyndrickxia camelliae]|uniref:FUSC family protein n=1 Tax=Heyndrickxia camelliae TaxID=1707093 RepID=A0A2N3LLG6_9BACI|nr:FUSC family protein [Heyndrickxia camelliae]PKR85437.1 FUSC family protein [Heyndrickxia camelliae]
MKNQKKKGLLELNRKHRKKATSSGFSSWKSSLGAALKQAFEVKKTPFPWTKAVSAGICTGLPAMIGLMLGNLHFGLIAGIGSFTYLYMFNEPYATRAKKLGSVMIGMSLSVGIGSLLAPSPIASAIMVGIIGFIATFVFGALKIPGPAAIFFVLGFTMTTAMPLDPTQAPLRAALVLSGGAIAWIIGMLPRILHPHGPETTAVIKVYHELANFIDAVGTDSYDVARHKIVLALKTAEDTLAEGYISWKVSNQYKRLILLNDHANNIFLSILEHTDENSTRLPKELSDSVRLLTAYMEQKNTKTISQIQLPDYIDETTMFLFSKVYDADAILNEPVTKINHEVKRTTLTLQTLLGGAFDKNSMVFHSSLRYGIVLVVAALIAYYAPFNRSYWIPLSCAAVMSGSTIISTFHRAIQRSFGTIIGILIASFVLSTHPQGIVIVFLSMILTFLTELFIVRNYAIAAFFITPNALLMAESSTSLHNVSYFATVRVIDIIIGCMIGLLGAIIIGRRRASMLLPHIMAKTIRSQEQFFMILFSEWRSSAKHLIVHAQNKMHTNLTNLKVVYTTALGELPNNKTTLEYQWPSIFSIEQLGYLLDACFKLEKRPILDDKVLSQYLLVFEMMAKSTELSRPLPKKDVPDIPGLAKVPKEIRDLQNALQINEKASTS